MTQPTILLFYKYTTIKNPEKFRDEHVALCLKLGFKGRIIIASEGINATFEGEKKNVEKYKKILNKMKGFKNIHWKQSDGTGNAFPRLSVKVRSEIVTLGLGAQDIDPRKVTGKHIKPETLRKLIKGGKKIHIIDMRNTYEHIVGHFKGSILPKLENFRDLPKELPKLAHLKGEKVVTVCTGGVRCEKASGYLVANGFKDVSQLSGGIVSYMEQYPGEDFLGSLYVFDGRETFAVSGGKRVIIGSCRFCKGKTENYYNCANNLCHIKFLACATCTKGVKDVICGKVRCQKEVNKLSRKLVKSN